MTEAAAFVGFVPDLMDRSKLSGVRFVARASALLEAPERAVVLDLGRAGAIDLIAELVASGRRVVGFVSHVDRVTVEAARAAGCESYPRSELFRRWPDIASG